MSTVIEVAAGFFGMTPEAYRALPIDPVILGVLNPWDPPTPATHQAAVRLAVRTVGSVHGDALHEVRDWLLRDWFARAFAPSWLEAARQPVKARAMRAGPLLTSATQAHHEAVWRRINPRASSEDRRWDDVRYAARRAMLDSAGSPVWDATWGQETDRRLGNVIWNIAETAVTTAAERAARGDPGEDAIYAALRPTVLRVVPTILRRLRTVIDVGLAP